LEVDLGPHLPRWPSVPRLYSRLGWARLPSCPSVCNQRRRGADLVADSGSRRGVDPTASAAGPPSTRCARPNKNLDPWPTRSSSHQRVSSTPCTAGFAAICHRRGILPGALYRLSVCTWPGRRDVCRMWPSAPRLFGSAGAKPGRASCAERGAPYSTEAARPRWTRYALSCPSRPRAPQVAKPSG